MDIFASFSQNFTVSSISLNTSGGPSNVIFVTIAIIPFQPFKPIALEAVNKLLIRKWHNRMMRWMDAYRDGLNAKDAHFPVQAFQRNTPIVVCWSGLLLRLIRLDYQYYYLWYHLLYMVYLTLSGKIRVFKKKITPPIFAPLKISLDILFRLSDPGFCFNELFLLFRYESVLVVRRFNQ